MTFFLKITLLNTEKSKVKISFLEIIFKDDIMQVRPSTGYKPSRAVPQFTHPYTTLYTKDESKDLQFRSQIAAGWSPLAYVNVFPAPLPCIFAFLLFKFTF